MHRTIAVTGASGHLGNVVCRQLCEQGFRVRALCRADTRALNGLPLDIVPGDVLDLASLEQLMQGCDAVVHSAAIISIHGDPDGTVFTTNTEGTANVLKAATRCGLRRMVHISSVHAVEEHPHAEPFDESRPYKTRGAFAYDYSKSISEQILLAPRNGGPEVVVLRPSAIIGPFDFKPSELGKALLDFHRRKVPVLPPGGYNFVDVRDVATSVVQAIDKARAGQVYLLTGKYHDIKSVAQIVESVSGVRTSKRTLSYGMLMALLPLTNLIARISGTRPALTREAIAALVDGHPRMDGSKAERELGHRSRPLETSIRDFYDWYQQKYGKI